MLTTSQSHQWYMARVKLGSKSDVFHLDDQAWFCSTGLPSDAIIEVGEISFHLHKFPLLSRSNVLENLFTKSSGKDKKSNEDKSCVLELHDIPGGAKAFLLIAKFCYGVKIEITAFNIVSLRCAAEYLQMNEDYGVGNLIAQTESFLNEVLDNWTDTIKALGTCEEVLPHAEELHIVSRCINSLAKKACSDPSLFSWTVSGDGIHMDAMYEDWWYDDVSALKLPLYKRLILAIGSEGMKPERITGSLMLYAKKYLPLLGRKSSFQMVPWDSDQMTLLEDIVVLLPSQKGVTPTKFLLRLLRTSMMLNASSSCRESLENLAGAQLDEAGLEDILIPNMGYSIESLYDVDCVQRILHHFMMVEQDTADCISNGLDDEGQFMEGSHLLTPMTKVATLIDSYLAEVAPDINLKLPKFLSLAAVIPEYARPLDDGIYRAIDIYLKAHPWLTDSEREHICRLMNCHKLSIEASTHAAQNDRLPLRFIVQVLFFEQLRLRTSVACGFFISDNLDNSKNQSENLSLSTNDHSALGGCREDDVAVAVDEMRERVFELEKECFGMKQEMQKIVKAKGSWNSFCRRFGIGLKLSSCTEKTSKSNYPQVLPPSRRPCGDGKLSLGKG